MIKCELIVGGYSYRVTDDVRNWDDMVVSMKRADYDGVVRSFTSKFEFVNGAYSLLKKQYRENYLGAAASVVISRRNNSWGWNEVFRCTLDFSTYNDDGMAISINAVDDSLASLIKAKRGTQYEYSVNVIKEEKQLMYDGLKMRESVVWQASGSVIDGSKDVLVSFQADIHSRLFPLYEYSSERSVGRYFVNGSTNDVRVSDSPDSYLLMATEDGGCDVSINFSIDVPAGKYLSMKLAIIRKDGSEAKLKEVAIGTETLNRNLWLFFNMHIFVYEGDRVIVSYLSMHDFSVRVSDGSLFSAGWNSRVKPAYVDVVKPIVLLNRLLQSMNGGREGLTGVIDYNGHPNLLKCVIVAAESVRGLKGAKVYSSYSKFCDWMSAVFGFVPAVGDNRVTFVHRDSLFRKEVVKTIDSISDFEYSTDSSMIYSRVRVGYEKQDYDSINGRDEFRFTNEYTSGINLTDNTLELISPYRADAYGIEFLVHKRGEDTTDNSSDNNVFFVNAIESDRNYSLVRDIPISGVLSPDTMFNVVYAPSFMINANKNFIGASVSGLTFASGDGNSDVVIDGVAESSDITINSRLFTVGTASIETADLVVSDDLFGLVSFEKNREVYRGYVKSVGSNYGRDEAVKYVLIIESVTRIGEKRMCTIAVESSFISPIIYEKIVSDNPVSSNVSVKRYIVNEETGFKEDGDLIFIIPKGGTESERVRTSIALPGYRIEYSLDTDEDSECIYVLSI